MDGISEDARRYVSAAVADMQASGVTVTLATEESSGFGGGKLGGYFDEDGPTFFVAQAVSPQVWLSVFVHEYQHFRQWQNNYATWMAKLGGDCCAWYVFDAWLQGVVELTPQQRDDALRIILECERECELMTLAEIEKHPGIGLRQWYQLSPYSDDTLTALMPDDRLLTVEESLRPVPHVFGAIAAKVFTEIA
jgi:hypothetical protein